MRDVIVSNAGGRTIHLTDVAEVKDTLEKATQDVRMNGKRCVTVIIQKQSGANTVEAAENLLRELPEIMKTEPKLDYNIVNDHSEFIKSSISNLEETCIMAVVIVFFVLLAFFRSISTSLVVATAIPVSLVGTFAFMSSMGMTLNVISLAGLSLAVGMLVDELFFNGNNNSLLNLSTHFGNNDFSGIVVDNLIYGCHHTEF